VSGHALALGCLGLALALGAGGTQATSLSGRSGVEPGAVRPARGGDPPSRLAFPAAGRAVAAVLGVAVAVVVAAPAGLVAGILAFLAADRAVRALEPKQARRRRRQRAAELPLVLDLLSVCLRAGMPLVAAVEAVAAALPGPFSADLAVVAGLQRLGSSPAAAWSELADDPDLGPVARAVRRSAESGSRLAAAFERIATDRRAALTAEGQVRARSAGVTAMAPLGLCFLPAFVSLGIVPIVLSLAEDVLP